MEVSSIFYIFGAILLIVLLGGAIYIADKDITILTEQNLILTEKNNLYLQLLSLRNIDISNMENGNKHYELASLAYERDNYVDVVYECEEARGYYSDYTQDIRDERERVSRLNESIFKTYTNLLSSEIKIYNNMYEACEYFESAARQFEHYYLTTTPANDVSYQKGNDAINSMNEKINAHDFEVEVYNTILAKYNGELKEIIDMDLE